MSTKVDEPAMKWKTSVWFSDVDDTLIDTEGGGVVGAEAVRQVFEPHCGKEKALAVQKNFLQLYDLMAAGYRAVTENDWLKIPGGKQAFDVLVSEVASLQPQLLRDFGHTKKWSREIFIKLAADRTGVHVTPELVHEASDAYWITLTGHAHALPDALALSKAIYEHGRPLYLVTSSDVRMQMQPDGSFVYDPKYSEGLKRQRIEILREKGFVFNVISIGDPEDKPNLDFFEKAIRTAEADLNQTIDTAHSIMLGDSYGGDLQTPKEQLGFGLVVLRQRGKTQVDINDAHQLTVGDLSAVASYFV